MSDADLVPNRPEHASHPGADAARNDRVPGLSDDVVTRGADRRTATPLAPFSRTNETIATAEELRAALGAGRNVRLTDCKFDCPLDLADQAVRGRVVFERCVFNQLVDLSRCRFENGLVFDGSVFTRSLTLRDALVRGPLSLRDVSVRPAPDVDKADRVHDWRRLTVTGQFDARRLDATAGINLYRLRAEHDLELSGVRLEAPAGKEAINLSQARVRGNVTVGWSHRRATVDGRFNLAARVDGRVSFAGAVLSVKGDDRILAATALLMDGASVAGGMSFRHDDKGNPFECVGRIDLKARVGSSVRFEGAKISVENVPWAKGVALDMSDADVADRVVFEHGDRHRFECVGQIILRGRVGSQVSFRGASLSVRGVRGADGIALDMEEADVGAGLFFEADARNHRFECVGQIDLRAKISGQVNFRGALLSVRGTGAGDDRALNMNGAVVGGSVVFAEHGRGEGRLLFQCEGQLDLRARVRGYVLMRCAQATVEGLREARGVALRLSGAAVESLSLLNHDGELTVRGDVDARYLRASALKAEGDLRGQLDLTSATIDHDVKLNLSVRDGLLLDYAQVGHLKAKGCRLGCGNSPAVSARHCRIKADADFCECRPCAVEPPAPAAPAGSPGRPTVSRTTLGGVARRVRSIRDRVLRTQPAVGVPAAADRATADPPEFHPDSEPTPAPPWRLDAARIGGNLTFRGAQIAGGLAAEDATINGEVNFTGASIAGDLVLRSARVLGRVFGDETEQAGPYPQVAGKVDLRYACLADVALWFEQFGAHPVPTAIHLGGAKVDRLSIKGTPRDKLPFIDFDGCEFKTLEVNDLQRAPVRHRNQRWVVPAAAAVLLWWLSRWIGPLWWAAAGFAVSAAYAGIARRESYRDALRLGTFLALSAVIAVRIWEGGLWGIGVALGFVTVAALVKWVAARRRHRFYLDGVLTLLRHATFRRGFYIAVEQYFRREGDDAAADEIFVSRRKREVRPRRDEERARPTVGMRLWHELLDLTVGYGVRVGRLIQLFVLLFLLTWTVFSTAASVERPLTFVQPADPGAPPEAGDNVDGRNRWRADGGAGETGGKDPWGQGHGFFMAARISIPLIDVLAEGDWEPSNDRMSVAPLSWTWCTYENFAAGMTVANLVLVPLLIAGATGFLKKRE